MKNVAIIEGGYSHEKVISLQSAETVYQNIDREKYNPIKVRIPPTIIANKRGLQGEAKAATAPPTSAAAPH